MRLLAKPNQLDHPRLAVIVGKKTVALASSRNYIKRVLREIFRLHQDRFGAWDIVILARKGFDSSVFDLVEQEFMQLISDLQNKLVQK